METQENQPKPDEPEKKEDQEIPEDSDEKKEKSYYDKLRELPYTNDRVGKVYIRPISRK